MNLEQQLPLVEEIFAPWRERIGDDFMGYRNHVYRMIHFCFALHDCNEEERKKIIVAGAFHDIGIWSAGTLDYLPPSVAQAQEYLKANGLESWSEEISLMVDLHHKMRPYADSRYPLVEVFRKADLVDFSLGLFKCGLPGSTVKQVRESFPNAGFHKRLVQLSGGLLVKRPWKPFPAIFRW